MNTPGREKRCPVSACSNTHTRNILSAAADWWQNTAARQLASKPRERKRKRGREYWRDALFLTFPGPACLYVFGLSPPPHRGGRTALDPSVSRDLGWSRIALETQHLHHNEGSEYEEHPVMVWRMKAGAVRTGECVSIIQRNAQIKNNANGNIYISKNLWTFSKCNWHIKQNNLLDVHLPQSDVLQEKVLG